MELSRGGLENCFFILIFEKKAVKMKQKKGIRKGLVFGIIFLASMATQILKQGIPPKRI